MDVNVLVVDDDRNMASIVSKTMNKLGYKTQVFYNGETALNALSKGRFDFALLDLRLPDTSGEEILSLIKANYSHMDVIIMTAFATVESAIKTMKSGAYDYIVKPVNIDNLIMTVQMCMEKRELFQQLTDEKKMRSKISELYDNLNELFVGTVESLGDIIEAKDIYTGGHCERMDKYSSLLSAKLLLSPTERNNVRYAALLHDIGKIAIPESILLKPGRLTESEFSLMKHHTVKGVKVLKPIRQLNEALPGIKYHHERFDGKGYPDGLAGDKIPLIGRIICIADSFDVMTSDRPYRKRISSGEALKEIIRCSGSQFDPDLVKVFVDNVSEVLKK